MVKPKTFALVLLFLFFVFFLRWNGLATPFERDEGEYAYGAWIITQGGFPYQDTFLQKPPLIVYTYLLGEKLVGNNLWFPRFMAIVFTILTAYFLGKIAQKHISQGAFWYVFFLYPLLLWSPINSGLAANTEVFMLLPVVFVLWLMERQKTGLKDWFWAGMATSFALAYKPICLYVLAGILFAGLKNISLWKLRFKAAALLVTGGILSLLVIIAPVIYSGSWTAFWQQAVVFNALYAKQWGFSLLPMLANLGVMAKSFWLVYLLLFLGLVLTSKNRVWYVYLLLGFAAVFQTTIRHYYLLLVPFVTLISIEVLMELKQAKLQIVAFVVLIISILYPIRQQFLLTPQELSLWIYGSENPFYESPMLANKLKAITSKEDCVFVAGSEPQILYYASRSSCTKFDITYPLIIDTNLRAQFQDQLEADLRSHPPKAVVFSTLAHSGLWDDNNKEVLEMTNNLLKDYVLVDQSGGLMLYVKK